MSKPYRYPDPDERLTVATVRATGVAGSEWGRQEPAVLDRFAQRLARLSPRRRLIDYGSGEGRLSSRFADLFDTVTAYEPDDQRRARHAADIGRTGVPIDLRATFDRTAAIGAFDGALCSHVLQHVSRATATAVLVDLATVLRPGGALLLLTTLAGPLGPRYVVSRMGPEGRVVESDVDATEFEAACQRNLPGELPIHFYGLSELMTELGWHGFVPMEVNGLHGAAGVVGPIDPDDALTPPNQPGRTDWTASAACRDVAVFALRG